MRNKQLIITLTTAIITALVTRKIVRFADNKKLERKMRELDERLDRCDDYDYDYDYED